MSCTVPTVAEEVLISRVAERASADRLPLWTTVEVIATCNFRCHHCYIAPCAERSDVMPLARAEALLQEMAARGTLYVLLTGGEVFTHPQFREIYLAAKRLGLIVVLNTNAYMIGERWADFLAEWPPSNVSISLYGLSDERYEQVTGIPHAFGRVVRAIDLLAERGINMELKCPAMTNTVDELPAMKAFAQARGLTFRYDPAITPQEKGSADPVGFQLSPSQVLAVDELVDDGVEAAAELYRTFAAQPATGRLYSCGAGRFALHVNVHGEVSTCTVSRRSVGNFFRDGFDAVWSALGTKVSAKFPPGHPCAACRLRPMCLACPATVEEMTGATDGYVQHYCRITHLRAARAGAHPTGIPRTVVDGIPAGIRTPGQDILRMLPVLQQA